MSALFIDNFWAGSRMCELARVEFSAKNNYSSRMKRWVCIILLITLSSMHGIFEAAGSLSNGHMMALDIQSTTAAGPAFEEQCCDGQKIDVSDLVFHCPLDGKILSSKPDISLRKCAQLHEAVEPYSLADAFDQFFLRPPIA